MEKLSLNDVDVVPHFMGINSDRRPLASVIEELGFAATYLELEPGEAFSGGLHTHRDQEELFVVLEGTAMWETKSEPGDDPSYTEVGPMEVIHFARDDDFQTGRNESDGLVRALAIGVPGRRHDHEETLVAAECESCGRETVHTIDAEGRMPDPEETTIVCQECGHELL